MNTGGNKSNVSRMFRALARFATLLLALFLLHSYRAPLSATLVYCAESVLGCDQSNDADASNGDFDDAGQESGSDADDSDSQPETLYVAPTTPEYSGSQTLLAQLSHSLDVRPWFASREPRPGELA